jgi:hypothetical protein
MNLEYLTFLILVGFFVAAEVYRFRRGMSGEIVGLEPSTLGPVVLPVQPVRVRLDAGDEVTATMNCCVACLGRLQVGDRVRVTKSREGFVVDLPWTRGKSCRSGTC